MPIASPSSRWRWALPGLNAAAACGVGLSFLAAQEPDSEKPADPTAPHRQLARSLDASLAEAEKRLQRLAERLTKAEEDRATLEALQAKHTQASTTIETLRKERDSALAGQQTAQQQAEEAARSLTAARDQWLATESQLHSQLKTAQQGLQEHSKELSTLRQSENEAKREHQALSEQLNEQGGSLSQSRRDLAASQEQLRSLRDELKSNELARTRLLEERDQEAQVLQATQNELDTWKLQFAEIEKRWQTTKEESLKLNDALTELQSNESASGELQAEMERLNAHIVSLETENAVLEKARTQQDTLEIELAKSKTEIEDLHKSHREQENTWKQEKETYRATAIQLQTQLDDLQAAEEVLRAHFLQITPVRYAINSSEIATQKARVLNQIQRILAIYPRAQFSISGHTCTIGAEERNRVLSEERALLLKAYLIENGVAEAQLEAKGYGHLRPIADNATADGRQQNRRVEVHVRSTSNQ